MKYRLLKDRFEHPAGTVVQDYEGYDYGLSQDDERAFGFFTVPAHDLKPLK